jgi:hypothetical protein
MRRRWLTPGRPSRRFFSRSVRFAFWPFEGGVLELSGVLGGVLSLASNSAIRAVNNVICEACASIRPTRSSLERVTSVPRSTDMVNRVVRYHVKRGAGRPVSTTHQGVSSYQ